MTADWVGGSLEYFLLQVGATRASGPSLNSARVHTVIPSLLLQSQGMGTEIKPLAERGFDPRTSGLWAQHASTAPLCSVT